MLGSDQIHQTDERRQREADQLPRKTNESEEYMNKEQLKEALKERIKNSLFILTSYDPASGEITGQLTGVNNKDEIHGTDLVFEISEQDPFPFMLNRAPSHLKYFAQDQDGSWWGFEEEPYLGETTWRAKNNTLYQWCIPKHVDNWRKTLRKRPENK